MGNGGTVLQFQDVTKFSKKNGKQTLNRVNLEVYSGEIVAVLGVNGAGKSTLMRSVFGLTGIDQGTITLNGYPSSSLKGKGDAMFIPDIFSFYPYFTIKETINFFSNLHQLEKSYIQKNLEMALDLFGLGSLSETRIDSLTKGQQQRTALACAALVRPEILILDEPFNGLDQQGITNLKSLFKDLKKEKKSVLFSTHNIENAQELSDRIAILARGKIMNIFNVQELKKKGKLKSEITLALK